MAYSGLFCLANSCCDIELDLCQHKAGASSSNSLLQPSQQLKQCVSRDEEQGEVFSCPRVWSNTFQAREAAPFIMESMNPEQGIVVPMQELHPAWSEIQGSCEKMDLSTRV